MCLFLFSEILCCVGLLVFCFCEMWVWAFTKGISRGISLVTKIEEGIGYPRKLEVKYIFRYLKIIVFFVWTIWKKSILFYFLEEIHYIHTFCGTSIEPYGISVCFFYIYVKMEAAMNRSSWHNPWSVRTPETCFLVQTIFVLDPRRTTAINQCLSFDW